MAFSWTPRRRDEPELMDAPGLPDAEVAEAYQVLRRVNRQLGNLRTIDRELRRYLDEAPPASRPVTILDAGSGSGDIAESLRERLQGRHVEALGLALDRDATAVRLASKRRLAAVRGDALRLPFADRSIDVVLVVKFAHHFSGRALSALAAEMARVARHRVILLDIRRHWLAYWGFVAWSRLFTRNRLVRYDGPLSVLRGFTPDELTCLVDSLPSFSWTVRSYSGFQIALVGRRLDARTDQA